MSLFRAQKNKISSEGSPQLQSWAGSCSIENEPSEDSCLIKDERLEPRNRCLYHDSRVGFPSLEHRQTDDSLIGDKSFGW